MKLSRLQKIFLCGLAIGIVGNVVYKNLTRKTDRPATQEMSDSSTNGRIHLKVRGNASFTTNSAE